MAPQSPGDLAAAADQPPIPTSSPSAVRDPAAPAPASGAPANPLPGPLSAGGRSPGLAIAEPALGVWLTTVDSAVMYDPAEAGRALLFLRQNGFRRAALPLYTAGVVTWTPARSRNRLAIRGDLDAGTFPQSPRHSHRPAVAPPRSGRRGTPSGAPELRSGPDG